MLSWSSKIALVLTLIFYVTLTIMASTDSPNAVRCLFGGLSIVTLSLLVFPAGSPDG